MLAVDFTNNFFYLKNNFFLGPQISVVAAVGWNWTVFPLPMLQVHLTEVQIVYNYVFVAKIDGFV